jgi:hypothetical protein
MRAGRLLVVLALAGALAACGTTVAGINARPDKYYQKRVEVVGRIARRQVLPGATLLEIVDPRGSRILVRATAPIEAEPGDWVEVEGILVPEARVGEAMLYDVITAERVSRHRAPRFRNLM